MADTKKGRGSAQVRNTAVPSAAAPSASIVVISPANEVLLLRRVQNGTFAAAHVFPGGNLSSFHEGALIPASDSAERHVDGPAYRLAAIRETFEESGVLLARPRDDSRDGDAGEPAAGERQLLQVPQDMAGAGRKRVEGKEVRFTDWLASVGGEADSDGLIPFTRWITPPSLARRFTTQMYLYLLPLAGTATTTTATADQTEVSAAEFAPAATWVQRAQRSEIILFPPQMYILALLAPILGRPDGQRTHERERLAELLRRGSGPEDGTGQDQSQAWAELVISPRMLARLPDGRTALGLDQPGPELRHSGRTGDLHRVMVGNMSPGPPRDVQLQPRAEVLAAIRAVAADAAAKAQAAATTQAVSREGKTRL